MIKTIICVVIGVIIAPIILTAAIYAIALLWILACVIINLLVTPIIALPVMIYEHYMEKQIEKHSEELEHEV